MRSYSILLLVMLFMTVLCYPLVSAELQTLGVFKHNSTIGLKQIAANSTSCNITSVNSPNFTTLVSNVEMQKDGSEYNYTLFYNYTQEYGYYIVNGICNEDGVNKIWTYDFRITQSGYDLNDDDVTRGIYFMAAITILFFIAFLSVNFDKIPLKWTFFLLSMLFMLITFNLISISLHNNIGNTSIAQIFDQISAVSFVLYYFIFFLLVVIWALTTLGSLADRKRMKMAESIGSNNMIGDWR